MKDIQLLQKAIKETPAANPHVSSEQGYESFEGAIAWQEQSKSLIESDTRKRTVLCLDVPRPRSNKTVTVLHIPPWIHTESVRVAIASKARWDS